MPIFWHSDVPMPHVFSNKTLSDPDGAAREAMELAANRVAQSVPGKPKPAPRRSQQPLSEPSAAVQMAVRQAGRRTAERLKAKLAEQASFVPKPKAKVLPMSPRNPEESRHGLAARFCIRKPLPVPKWQAFSLPGACHVRVVATQTSAR